jgi:HD-GYP domain-containing protein (c-di-GMP phosphodiesterase class II)
MRLKLISEVQTGEVLAKPLYLQNGSMLVGSGVKLTARMIERLRGMGIDRVYTEDSLTMDINPEDVISEQTRREAVQAVRRAMLQTIDGTLVKSRAASYDIGSTFRNVFNNILNDISKRDQVMINMASLHTADGYLFHHSVNVAILAGIMGLSKGYNPAQLEELGVGALLFDIGMVQIEKPTWNKKDELTDDDRKQIELHTEKGFQLLRNRFDIPLVSAHCAYQHHERYDGRGYPRHLKSKEIHEYAQIVAIADVYDALTSVRPHRNRLKPSEAIEYLYASGNGAFDLGMVQQFTENICIYPVSTTVMLSTGQIGVVSANRRGSVQRPTVRILREENGVELKSPYEIDLRERLNVTIISSI